MIDKVYLYRHGRNFVATELPPCRQIKNIDPVSCVAIEMEFIGEFKDYNLASRQVENLVSEDREEENNLRSNIEYNDE